MFSFGCCIGKFMTSDNENDVNQSVINWLEENKNENKGKIVQDNIDNEIVDYHQLPLSFISGWVSF